MVEEEDEDEMESGDSDNKQQVMGQRTVANGAKSWDVMRKQIIEELKNQWSEVNISILTVKITNKVECEKIWANYAPQFDEKSLSTQLEGYCYSSQKGGAVC